MYSTSKITIHLPHQIATTEDDVYLIHILDRQSNAAGLNHLMGSTTVFLLLLSRFIMSEKGRVCPFSVVIIQYTI